jgi:hypothetical protein
MRVEDYLRKRTKSIVFAIFFISIGLRLILAYINRDANDDHLQVINWIVDKHQIPQKTDCWECFQPKFFYVLSADIIAGLNIQSTEHRIMAIQFMNVILGFLTIFLFWMFIKKQPLNDKTKLLLFAYFAFNPCLAGINVQATNDTMEIFFGVLAVYFCDVFFSKTTIFNFTFLLFAALGAALTKATGIMLFIVIAIFFAIKIFAQAEARKKLSLFIFLLTALAGFFGVVVIAGGYYSYYRQYNSIPGSVLEKAPPPLFFQDTYPAGIRPGVINMAESFFTFRYFDMIIRPSIPNGMNDYPLHRTSLWSQLYGRTVFLQFDQWPPTWQTDNPAIMAIGRVLIILGLVPLLLFLSGLWNGIYLFSKNILKKSRTYLAYDINYLHLGVTLAFLAAIVKYTYDYRAFSAMKAIYIFPGFISYIKLFSNGYSSVKNNTLTKSINLVLLTMIVFSVIDIGCLILQLHYPHYFRS